MAPAIPRAIETTGGSPHSGLDEDLAGRRATSLSGLFSAQPAALVSAQQGVSLPLGQPRAPQWPDVAKVLLGRETISCNLLCPQVLHVVHGQVWAGHLRIAKTLHRLRGLLY